MTKPKGYWKKEENVLAEARQVMKEQDWSTLPPARELEKSGYSSLSSSIGKYHGGIQQFRTTLGQTNHKKQYGYWQQEENTIAEARQIMEKHEWNTLPSKNELEKHGYSSLIGAIIKYHGGIQQFRTTLGQKNTKKPQRYWQNESTILSEAQEAMKEQKWNTLPSARELIEKGYSSLSFAIIQYHGGMYTFREKLGQTNITKPHGYWQSLDNTLAEARKAIQQHRWNTLPLQQELRKHRYSALSKAISKYHGGLIFFRRLLTEHQTGKTTKQQLEELLDEYIAA